MTSSRPKVVDSVVFDAKSCNCIRGSSPKIRALQKKQYPPTFGPSIQYEPRRCHALTVWWMDRGMATGRGQVVSSCLHLHPVRMLCCWRPLGQPRYNWLLVCMLNSACNLYGCKLLWYGGEWLDGLTLSTLIGYPCSTRDTCRIHHASPRSWMHLARGVGKQYTRYLIVWGNEDVFRSVWFSWFGIYCIPSSLSVPDSRKFPLLVWSNLRLASPSRAHLSGIRKASKDCNIPDDCIKRCIRGIRSRWGSRICIVLLSSLYLPLSRLADITRSRKLARHWVSCICPTEATS